MIAAGAQGAWIGTPFLVATEARNSQKARAAVIAARETDTVLTDAFDAAQSIPWPAQFRGRALRNAFTDRWHDREGAMDDAARRELGEAKRAEDYRVANLYAGQAVGLVSRVEPAADIVARIVSEAAARLRALRAVCD